MFQLRRQWSICMRLLLNFQAAYSWPHVLRTLTRHVGSVDSIAFQSRRQSSRARLPHCSTASRTYHSHLDWTPSRSSPSHYRTDRRKHKGAGSTFYLGTASLGTSYIPLPATYLGIAVGHHSSDDENSDRRNLTPQCLPCHQTVP
ncbi:hypothetical protein AVEN_272383-1 [Araneus ventricosus]|uniref:Secreted protein n=1 Tax=Araneus ventricosus TaxID=182803 RepID=A0A4Y2HZT5_ARAVE|nr:hypothetical protein AVEN_272383-1 [Araneus ventricosus]